MRVFITGASSGIGAAMAKKFDALGAQLGLVGRSQDKLDNVLAGLRHAEQHTTYALDVTDRQALFAAARDFDGKAPVDIVPKTVSSAARPPVSVAILFSSSSRVTI